MARGEATAFSNAVCAPARALRTDAPFLDMREPFSTQSREGSHFFFVFFGNLRDLALNE
jgi:hypothetical protein